jgi:hypothetical protein
MAKVTDPDTLVRNTDVTFNTGTKKITVASGTNIDAKDGVTLKCLYSFCKEEWKADANLIPYAFPWVPITDEQFELQGGWDFADDTSRYLVRDGGWAVIDPTTGNPSQMWAGVVSLGALETNDQPYFVQSSSPTASPVDFQTTGVINQAVQIFKDVDADGSQEAGDFDYRTFLAVYGREQAQIYGRSALADIGVAALSYQAYRFPLSTSSDLNIAESDVNIAANSPYTAIKVRYFASDFAKDVDLVGTPRNFGIVIDVGTHSGVDGSCSASGNSMASTEGGIPTDGTYDGGALTIHEGNNKGTYTIGTVVSATAVPITTTFPEADTGMSFTLQRATPVVATKKEIYEKVQYLLRQETDADSTSGTNVGKTASELLEFVGSTLKAGTKTPTNHRSGGSGVIIMGFDANDTNDLVFVDNTGPASGSRTYPFVAAGSIAFNTNLRNDASAKYWVFFEYTERFVNTGFAIADAGGATATLTSTTTNLVTELASGDFIKLSGFTAANDNGIFECTAAPTGSGPWGVAVTKVDGLTLADEAAGASVSLDKNPVGSEDAIIVKNNAAADIRGDVGGAASVAFDFDYDGNVQGGRTQGTNAAVVIRALGLITAQYVESTATIIRATGQSFSLVAPLERNYQNA